MATLVKIHGLDRANSAGDASVLATRGFRLPLSLKRAEGGTSMVTATLVSGAGNSAITFNARYPGAWGNNITVAIVAAGTNPRSIVVTYPSAGSAAPTITINLATTTGTPNASETSASVAASVNADPAAANFVTATAGGTGLGVVAAAAGAALATGADGTGSTLSPIYARASAGNVLVVDVDDPKVSKLLRRNNGRFVSLGAQ